MTAQIKHMHHEHSAFFNLRARIMLHSHSILFICLLTCAEQKKR